MTDACLYLTFDDGPDAEFTPRVLDLLDEAGMHATFFVIGEQALRSPALVRRIAAAGHGIGNHTFSHRHPWGMSESRARAQVRDGARAVSDVLGESPRYYRPPHGRSRTCMHEEARAQGETLVMWDLSAIDWGLLGTAARIDKRLARARAGDIVLMHDGRNRHNRPDQLLQVLPRFLQSLRERSTVSRVVPRT
jgi:peptidoglycan/xylan/chitin deacetylase (PgdA/CDA1 family)